MSIKSSHLQAKTKKGFTLIETVVSIALFALAILLTGAMYSLAQRSYTSGSDRSELTQNARVSLDRLSREVRQSVSIVTTLPTTNSDPLNPPANEIFFEDGHDISQITYIRYYLNDTDLMRKNTAYYFAAAPTTYVRWNALDQNGNPPTETTLSDRVIGEYFDDLQFWGDSNNLNIEISLRKKRATMNLQSSVAIRN